jgi:hypothetical protein
MKTLSILPLVGACAVLTFISCSSPNHGSGHSTTELFNGRDLIGWQSVLADTNVSREAVWSVRDGLIVCQGEPLGFLHTSESFTNFRLVVEYRWAPGAKPGNSGIFSRINGSPRPLPCCVEVQLQHGNAGDVMGLQGLTLAAGQPRGFEVMNHKVAGDIRGVKKVVAAEKPAGEWNHVEILAQGGSYTVWINEQKVNEVAGIAVIAGQVGLQSEGGEIHFRRVTITPMAN